MRKVTVHASREYQVIIGSGLLAQLGKYAVSLGLSGKAAVISESNVWPLYGDAAVSSLQASGFDVCHYIFDAGEASKNGSTYLAVLDFLAENRMTRSDFIVALGGGVTGDLTGFAAATYLRGITCIQVPTTLLAMVDSSVGGKTAIDLPCGKNLAGAFFQPSLVLCDTDTLNTLPLDIFRDGCAEVIKYGVLYDPDLFVHLEQSGLEFDRETVISRCVELKKDVVMADEFDRGERQKLNLGHTIGHAVEANSNFAVSHGQAVAIGMAIASRAACKNGICDEKTVKDICSVLQHFSLPTETAYSAQDLYSSALSDKKRSGGTVNLIVPQRIGSCVIRPVPVDQLLSFIKAGL